MTDITWTNITVRLGDLKPWADNPRTSSKAQAKRILKSFEQFGQAALICVDPDGSVLDGHQRLSALLTIHGKDYEVEARQSSRPLTDDERRGLVLALANATGSWSWDALANWNTETLTDWGFDKDTLKGWKSDVTALGEFLKSEAPAVDAEPQVDRAAELLEKWGVKLGDLWAIGDHRLICGDCTDAATVARVMGGEKARLVFTSPPYPGADMWDDIGKVQQVEDIGLDALRRSYDVLDNGCPVLWNIANTPIGTQAGVIHTTTTTTKVAADELGLLCYGEIIWSKPVQHLTPISFMMRPVVPNLIHEYIMVFYKGKRKQRENESGLSSEYKSIRSTSVWEISPESAKEAGHKAPFPIELANRCIALWSLEGDIVYEPFTGSGTTLVSGENLQRRVYAAEIEPKYCALTLERMATAFPSLSIRRVE
jgi:DNA modification methylase